jgi:hypothetical protein
VSDTERIRVAMQAHLNAAGYILMDSSTKVDDWEEYGAAVGLSPAGGWAFVAWLDDSTCPSCSGAGHYEAEITNCRSEEQAKSLLAQFRKMHT